MEMMPRSRSTAIHALTVLSVLSSASFAQLPSRAPSRAWPVAERCAPATGGDAAALLARAAHLTGLDALGESLAAYHAVDQELQAYQSDRPYPPFLSLTHAHDVTFDARSGATRTSTIITGQGSGPTPAVTTLSTSRATWLVRDTTMRPFPQLHAQGRDRRPLDVLATVAEWRAAGDARIAATCYYRDHSRVVIARTTTLGEERLYLDRATAAPVKLDREVRDGLWGQLHIEYAYMSWLQVGKLALPVTVSRLADGVETLTRTLGAVQLVPRERAPAMAVPDSTLAQDQPAAAAGATPPGLWNVDTARAGSHSFQLANVAYSSAVVLARDTIFILDATMDERRARADSSRIAQLFPGRHPLVLVVTDLAWPHIAGVRFWVARGALVVAAEGSRDMLQRVVERRWTSRTDLLEELRRAGSAPRYRFRAVRDSASLAGGDLRLFALDGAASEGALVAWHSPDRFLWASDYVQNTRAWSLYTADVARAVIAHGLQPARVAAEHIGVVPWEAIARLAPAP
ncbi:MAG: beta-lactamase protein [Gemmatimonadetes bacterium]|nr:beta-lactamase protein [Gemmatimonadota bacterium]